MQKKSVLKWKRKRIFHNMTSEKNVIIFSVKVGAAKNGRMFVEKKDQSLKDALAGIAINLGNYIIFAEVKDHHDKVAVSPTLLCGWLNENSLVELAKQPESKKTDITMAEHQANLAKFDQQTIFFVKMDDRKSKQSITNTSYVDFKCKDLCVSAKYGDSFQEALKQDGRFSDPEKFQLQNQGNIHEIDLLAKYFPNKVFGVKVKRSVNRQINTEPGPRDNKTEVKGSALSDLTGTSHGGIGDNGIIIKEEPDADNFLTSCSDTYKVIVERANKLFLGSEEAIVKIVKVLFSKTVDHSKPAWLIEKIASATSLVGRIACGSTFGTCFLVDENIVMTNCHVYDKICKEMKNPANKPPFIVFNYKRLNQIQVEWVEVEIDMAKCPVAKSPENKLDYALLRLKDHPYKVSKAKLYNEVFKNVEADGDGLVTIIGHPGDQPMVVDTDCRIIPKYLWRNELLTRALENETTAEKRCFYMSRVKIIEEITSEQYENRFAYDTSFIEGSSGSPVLNSQGVVVAMHTCGFKNYKIDHSNDIRLMEFGVSMAAIVDDLYKSCPFLAKDLFPDYYLPPMDVEP